MRHRDAAAIDRELELLASIRASIRRLGGNPSSSLIDDLLDERLALSNRRQSTAQGGRVGKHRV